MDIGLVLLQKLTTTIEMVLNAVSPQGYMWLGRGSASPLVLWLIRRVLRIRVAIRLFIY